MYDKYPSLQRVDKQDFGFRPTRYEIWKAGQMTESGKTNMPIVAKILQENGKDIVGVMFVDPKLNDQIAQQQYYDEFITSGDRIMLLTVPQQTNAENNMAIQMFKMTIGPTRAFKNFDANEAYCCNLFTINGVIDKITFSFSNPEKMIEFYSNGQTTENDDDEEEDFDNINLSLEFESEDHIRYENGNHVSGPHGGARRMIKIDTDKTQDNVHIVTLYNMDGDHPVWQNNIQMAPKKMQIIEMNDDKTVLRGFGTDNMENSFADYGMSLIYEDDTLVKCILHMHDRGVDIEYLKETEKEETDSVQMYIALTLLHLLIEEHEDGDALVLQSSLKSALNERFGIDVTLQEMSDAVAFINSFYNRPIIIEQWVQSGGFMSLSREIGFYTEMTKSFLRDTIETIN